MNIALLGYGRMGHEIEEAAKARGHNISLVIDVTNMDDLNPGKLAGTDVIIEFTTPASAEENVSKCLRLGKPVVSGTTGWGEGYDRVAELCRETGGSFIHSSNYSIGVNILFRLNSELARIMNDHKEYRVSVEEIHHIKKLDAPSGTAVSLVNGIAEHHSSLDGWVFEGDKMSGKVPVRSVREGTVPGTHTVEWESEIDKITLKHEAKGRKGFAAGAVLAAEYIAGRKGVFKMSDVLGF